MNVSKWMIFILSQVVNNCKITRKFFPNNFFFSLCSAKNLTTYLSFWNSLTSTLPIPSLLAAQESAWCLGKVGAAADTSHQVWEAQNGPPKCDTDLQYRIIIREYVQIIISSLLWDNLEPNLHSILLYEKSWQIMAALGWLMFIPISYTLVQGLTLWKYEHNYNYLWKLHGSMDEKIMFLTEISGTVISCWWFLESPNKFSLLLSFIQNHPDIL